MDVWSRGVERRIQREARRVGATAELVRQRGSHRFWRVTSGDIEATTVVPDHGSNDLGTGLLRSIEPDLAGALGDRWLR